MCANLNLPLLGKVPLDPRIAKSCDEGKSFLDAVPDSPAADVYKRIVQSELTRPDLILVDDKVHVFRLCLIPYSETDNERSKKKIK